MSVLERLNELADKLEQQVVDWWGRLTTSELPEWWRNECTPVSEEEMVEIRRRLNDKTRRVA